MNLFEALDSVRQAGAHLALDEGGPLLRGRVPDDVVVTLQKNRDRLAAILKLRTVHREMGLSEDEVVMIETALLSGRVNEIRIVFRQPEVAPA